MDLIEIESKQRLSREGAAAMLRKLADSLARHNDVQFERDGLRYVVAIPDDVELEFELEIDDDGGSLELELKW